MQHMSTFTDPAIWTRVGQLARRKGGYRQKKKGRRNRRRWRESERGRLRKARKVDRELGRAHANGKLCRAGTNIESAAGSIERPPKSMRGVRFSSSPLRKRFLHVEIRFATSTTTPRPSILPRGKVSECSLATRRPSWRRSLRQATTDGWSSVGRTRKRLENVAAGEL